jgi:hypothetical protein
VARASRSPSSQKTPHPEDVALRETIEAALRRLPLTPTRPGEWRISPADTPLLEDSGLAHLWKENFLVHEPWEGAREVLIKLATGVFFGLFCDRDRLLASGKQSEWLQARGRRLGAAATALKAAAKAVAELGPDEIDALAANERLAPAAIRESLHRWAHQLASARGLPKRRNKYEMAVIREAIVCYVLLVGRRPTIRYDAYKSVRYGPFVTFLTDLFKALRVSREPASAATRAVADYRRIFDEL